ncbi:MFS transporter [Glycomyces harbinensis]|uniref:Predicted arabinose efflux permease, MFS family n=1 Tax=Glycomyces harbinensis TaxID=58114 RepID=A0A1G6YK74_9ACTN|nr:MFS transporter [Glycomyces harbinensis]SDD90691.1 Predicted arabinose efflux permease, MFS family [Glycomyces harbinensis]
MSPVIASQLQRTFRALAYPGFRVYAAGQLIGTLAFWLQTTAVSWLVLELSGNSGTALGWTLALQFGPYLLFGLQGGKIADSFDKRRILLLCSLGSATVTATLGAVVLTGHIELWMVYVGMFAFGSVAVVEGPARQAFYSELVDIEALPNAVGLGSAIFNTSRIAGPALGGLLIALTSTGAVILTCAVVFLGPALACAVLLRRPLTNPVHRAADAGGIREALRYTAARPDIIAVLVVSLLVSGFTFNFALTLSMLARTEFNTGADSYGLLLTALAVGALAGSLASGRRSGRPTLNTMLVSSGLLGVGTLLVGLAPTIWGAMILLGPTGFAMVYYAQAANQRVQMGVRADYRGRVLSLYMLVFLGSTAVFAPLVGWIMEQYGARTGLWLGGLVAIATPIALAFAKRAQIRRRATALTGKAMP